MKKTLIIVDPQVDFITGEMSVPFAECAMKNLLEHLQHKVLDYTNIIVSLDWHPHNHCSFLDQGGNWPAHCIEFTQGAMIYPDLAKILCNKDLNANVIFAPKGMDPKKDSYSVEGSSKWEEVLNIALLSNQIDICGIAGDYCVHDTIESLADNDLENNIVVLTHCIASTDCENYNSEGFNNCGTKLKQIISLYNLKYV